MAITLVQTKTFHATLSQTSQQITLNADTVAGNTLIVAASADLNVANIVSGIADGGDTFARATATNTTSQSTELWYSANIAGRTTPTITVSFGVNSVKAIIIVREYSGLSTTPLDKAVAAIGLSAALNSGATAATTTANELVIGVGSTNWGSNPYTLGGGYGNLVSDTLSLNDMAMEDKTVSATGAQTATFSVSNSTRWCCLVGTFAAATVTFTPRQGLNINQTINRASTY